MTEVTQSSDSGNLQPGGAQPAMGPEGLSSGVVNRFFKLFYAPRQAFAAPRTSALWIVPMVVLSLLLVTEGTLTRDLTLAKMRTSIENNTRVPDAQREAMADRMETMMRSPIAQVLSQIGIVIAYWALGFLLPALLYFLGLNFILGASSRFMEVFMVTAFSGLITLPREILRLPIILIKQSIDVYTSPAALVDPSNVSLVLALNKFDLFDLYRTIIMVFGLAVVSSRPPRRTAIVVVIVWILSWASVLAASLGASLGGSPH
jgi:hypothetical protein